MIFFWLAVLFGLLLVVGLLVAGFATSKRRFSWGVNVLRGKGLELESFGWMLLSLAIVLPVVAWVGFGFTFWF